MLVHMPKADVHGIFLSNMGMYVCIHFSSEQCELPTEPDELKDGGQKSMYKHVIHTHTHVKKCVDGCLPIFFGGFIQALLYLFTRAHICVYVYINKYVYTYMCGV